jgi:hypothetical protein
MRFQCQASPRNVLVVLCDSKELLASKYKFRLLQMFDDRAGPNGIATRPEPAGVCGTT